MFFSVFLSDFFILSFQLLLHLRVHEIIFKRTLTKYPLKSVIAAFDIIILNIHQGTTCNVNGRGWESPGQEKNITQF